MKKNKDLSVLWRVIPLVLFLWSGCSPNKFLSEGEVLYKGPKIVLSGPEIPQKEKLLIESVSSKLQPKPNRKFLGLFYSKLWLYEKVEPKPGKEKGLKYWMKNKLGEKPVLVDGVDRETMALVVQKLMQDNGLFHTVVTPDVIADRRQAKILYTVEHTGVSRIGTFRLPQGLSIVDSLARSWKKYSIREGDVYKLTNFTKDREALGRQIRGQGFYDFTDKNILFLIDTARADHEFGVDLRIRKPLEDSLFRRYHIRDVSIYPTYSPESISDSLTYKRAISYKGLGIYQQYKYIGRKSLHKLLLLEPGRPYSVEDHDISVNRLINTGIFRYVNINYNKIGTDSLDVEIKLTPTKYQGVKFDVEASTSNRSFLGSQASVSYTNGNLFRGAERFSLKASAGTEFQIVNDKAILNILNVNMEARLEVPGLITGFKTRKIRSEVMPKTYLALEESFQKWLEYYTLNSLRLSGGYQWQGKNKYNHHLIPISFEWITLLNKTSAFDDLIDENPSLKQSFKSSIIFGPSYSINVTSRRSEAQRSYVYYTAKAELAGNLAYLIGRLANPDRENPYKIFGISIANFARIDNEVRHYWDINKDMSLVSRVGIGLGFSYGNSEVLPYVRQFFMGGPNTIRAFEFRTVGPGNYAPEDASESNPVEQSGDFQLLMNLEYRFTMYRFLKAALFVDAGNVWLQNPDESRPGGEFDIGQFYRQIALGSGLGIRLDFDFFALRVDLGIPIYKPFNKNGERWIAQFPEQGFKDWRKANWAWNIAIGYPF